MYMCPVNLLTLPMDDEDLEIFNIRAGTIDYGKEYEYLIPAYYAVHFIIENDVIDFKLSTNNKDMGDFDDVVIELEFKNNDKRLLALQLKHHANDKKNLPLQSLASEKGDFSLFRYCEQYKNIKITCEKSYKLDFNKFHFLLYTNSPVTDFVQYVNKKKIEMNECRIPDSDITICRHDICVGNGFINTSEQKEKSIYRFKYEGDKLDQQFLNQFCLYTKQKHVKVVQEKIIEDFEKIFGVENKDIAMNYILFFKYWYRGDNGCFKLTKTDIRLKIAELILTPYVMEIEFIPAYSSKKVESFVEATKKFDITVVTTTREDSVATIFKENIKAAVNFKEILEENPKTYDYLRKYRLITGRKQKFEDLTVKQLNLIAWYLNLFPLIIQTGEDFNKISIALKLIKYKNKKMKFVLLGDNIHTDDFDIEWKIFQNLSDIVDMKVHERLLETFTYLIQDRHEITIQELAAVHKEFLQIVTPRDLISTLVSPLLVGKVKEMLPKYYVKRFIPQIHIQINIIEQTDDLLIISYNGNLDEMKKVIKTNTIELDEYLLLDHGFTPKKVSLSFLNDSNTPQARFILVNNGSCTRDQLTKVFARKPKTNCHYFRFIDQNSLEWIQSTGSSNDLRNYQITDTASVVEDNSIFDHFSGAVNILCADPGMGKTVMMNFLANMCPKGYWVVKIDLNDHYKFFKEPNGGDLMDYLHSSENSFTKKVFNLYRNDKRIVVLWDSFDEMPQDIVDAVLKTIRYFKNIGYYQWISGRYYCRDILEDTFQAFALTLRQLSEEEQKEYAYNRLKDEVPGHLFDKILKRMYENLTVLSKCDYLNFSGVPLQVHMLTEIFCQEPEKYVDDNIQIVTITDIYQQFIEGKFNTFYRKVNPDLNKYLTLQLLENYKRDRLAQYKAAALKLYLPEKIFETLNQNYEELAEDIIKGRDNLGIIIRMNDDNLPIFAHKTYTEFLVALWFIDNIKIRKDLSKVLFREDFINVRLMFDIILAKNSTVHLALLYQNYNFFNTCSQDLLCLKDAGGRSPLHLICSWGVTCPLIPTVKDVMDAFYNNPLSEDKNYSETLRKLLKTNDPLEQDELFQWTAITYCDQSLSFTPLEAIASIIFNINFDKLDNFSHVATRCHYAVMYNCLKIFNRIPVIPFLKYTDNGNLLHACARYGRIEFLAILLTKMKYRWKINSQNNREETPLDIAACFGHLDSMELLLNNGARLNGVSLTPLFEAAKHGHIDCCRELLRRGAVKLNGALGNAVYSKSPEIIELLIEKGADVNNQNKINGSTPLLLASTRADNVEVVRKLLQHGADPKIKTKDGDNALDFAFNLKLEGNVYEIIKADRKIANVVDRNGVSPLFKAVNFRYHDIVDLLIQQGADVNGSTIPTPALHAAVYQNCEHCVLALLKAGTSPNMIASDGTTPLSEAVSVTIVEFLLRHGANVNLTNSEGLTALHYASYYGRLEIVQKLVENEANVNAKTNEGRTSLHYASNQKHPDVVEYLLENGAEVGSDLLSYLVGAVINKSEPCFNLLLQQVEDVNQRDEDEMTLLHYIVLLNNKDFVAILADAGADLNARDRLGYTPLQLAALGGDVAVIQELLQRGADVNFSGAESALFRAASMGDLMVVNVLLRAGADPNRKTSEGITPLYGVGDKKDYDMIVQSFYNNEGLKKVDYHINYNHEECVKLLVKYGADVNDVMDNSLRALHIFTHHRETKIMEILIGAGASVNVSDKYNQTPLHFACMQGCSESAKLLIDNEASIDVCDNFGKTPLAWAVENNHRDLMEILVNSGASVNYKSDTVCTTPLLVACSRSNLAAVDWLIGQGADVNQRGDIEKKMDYSEKDFQFQLFGPDFVNLESKNLREFNRIKETNVTNISPLNLSIVNKDEEIIKLLLRNGADVNEPEENGWHSFSFAIRATGGFTSSIVSLLLEGGASVNLVNEGETIPLCMAASIADENAFQLLLDHGADLTQSINDLGTTILHFTSMIDGLCNFTKRLLDSGAKVDIVDSKLATPLHYCAAYNSIKTMKLLMQYEANVDSCDEEGFTPLFYAVKGGFLPIVKCLKEAGASLDTSNKDGLTILMIACVHDNIEIAEYLLKSGASINQKDLTHGCTAAWYVCYDNGNLILLNLLYKNGADILIVDKDGNNLLHVASIQQGRDILEFLVENGVSFNGINEGGETPLHIACSSGNYEAAKVLVDSGAVLDAVDVYGDVALRHCLMKAHFDLLKWLVDRGAGVDVANFHGNTPLFMAAAIGNLEMVKFLHEKGASINSEDVDGDLPVHDAAKSGYLDIVMYLVENGADVKHTNNEGKTAFDLALENNKSEVCSFLKRYMEEL